MFCSRLPIGQPNKPQLTNDNCNAAHTQLEGHFGLNGPLYFSTSIVFSSSLVMILHDLIIIIKKISFDEKTSGLKFNYISILHI